MNGCPKHQAGGTRTTATAECICPPAAEQARLTDDERRLLHRAKIGHSQVPPTTEGEPWTCECGRWHGGDHFVHFVSEAVEQIIAARAITPGEQTCECVAYTIRTDYGTGVEHDVDRSSCAVHQGDDDA